MKFPFIFQTITKWLPLVAVIFFISGRNAIAQDVSKFSVRHFTDENGLPQNSIKAIAQDSLGFLWLGTENGVVRFDGTNFKVYDKSNIGLSQNRISDFQPAMQGDDADFYVREVDNRLIPVSHGRIIAGTHRVNAVNRLKLPGSVDAASVSLITGSIVYNEMPAIAVTIISGTVGRFFAYYHDRHIELFDRWEKQASVDAKDFDLNRMFRIGGKMLFLGKQGKVTMLDGEAGLKRYDLPLAGDILRNPEFGGVTENIGLYWNNSVNQAFFLVGNSLYALDLQMRTGKLETRLILDGFDVRGHSIKTIYATGDFRRIFLGSTADGLYEFTRNDFEVLTTETSSNVFYAQAAVNDSTVMVSTGFNLGMSTSAVPFQKRLPAIAGLSPWPWYLMVDSGQNRWLRQNDDIVRFAPDDQRVIGRWGFDDEPAGMFQDPTGRVWLQIADGKLYRFDPKGSREPVFFVMGPKDPACFAYHNGTLWIGANKGLHAIDIATRKVSLVPGTGEMNLRSIYLAAPGELWFTTYEHGFFLLRNGKLHSFPVDQKSYLSTSHCIYEDKNHFFWITTNKGLFQISKKDLIRYTEAGTETPYYHYYSRENGLSTNEFNGGCQPCAVRLKNGYLSLPSIKGLVWFKPESISPEVPSGAFFIDEVQVGGKHAAYSSDRLDLPHYPDEIRITIASAYFGNPDNQRFFYALAARGEKPEKWTPLDNEGTIHFSSMPSGEHTLVVRKHTGFGDDDVKEIRFNIHVEKAWYETLLAKSAATLLFVAGVFGAMNIQNRRLTKRNEVLEEAISKRTESLNQTLDALQDSENSLARQVQVQARMITSLTHDVRTPLNAARSVSAEIERLVAEEKYGMVSQIGNSITETLARVNVLLENTVNYMKVQLIDEKATSDTVHVHDLVTQKLRLFTLVAEKNGTKLVNDVPPDQQLRCNHYLLGIAVSNLIDNAIKNTLKGKVTVSTHITADRVTISVSDTGYGIPDRIIAWLNQNPIAGNTSESYPTNGIGLLIVKEVSRMMEAEIAAERLEVGSRVSVSFSVRPDDPAS
ncbi:Signal transduction histidine kinase [Dyadobacter soli]|uniref:histidine kinase n=1 Tax=Dyadobacter soli TaxID=659014 RepID=A0A1G8AUZ9_9BACT|nr:HAMP domain-containing sensor histidine kinase [Dyadobacter soli]SDH24791.1 Signal transduction histidine kinase [Dyadobacter soli]